MAKTFLIVSTLSLMKLYLWVLLMPFSIFGYWNVDQIEDELLSVKELPE